MNFIKSDILNLKDGKHNYDFLICSAVLHHLKNFNAFNKAIKKYPLMLKTMHTFLFM